MSIISEVMATVFFSWGGGKALTVGILAALTDAVSCSCYLRGQIL